MRFFIFILVALLSVQTTLAQTLEADFTRWVENKDMGPATLVAFGSKGRVIAEAGIGRAVDTPLPIASISKTLAAQCVLAAARMGQIDLEAPIRRYLDWPSPAGAAQIKDLLTHSAGLGPDQTQSIFMRRILKNPKAVQRALARVTKRGLAHDTGTYAYNNENYMMLNAALKAGLKTEPFAWCRKNAPNLAPLSSLTLSDVAPAIPLAGGIAISARDLATFFRALNAEPDWPSVQIDTRNSYGPGIIIQDTKAGTNLFHAGAYCQPGGPNFGAFAAKLDNGGSIAMIYSGCADDSDMASLNQLVLDYVK